MFDVIFHFAMGTRMLTLFYGNLSVSVFEDIYIYIYIYYIAFLANIIVNYHSLHY